MAEKRHKCSFCNYSSSRKFDVKRHTDTKHKIQTTEPIEPIEPIEPTEPTEPMEHTQCCLKCNKHYKTQKYLKQHEKNCRGIDTLTCPKCMKSFTSRQHKHRHIKADNCEPRSIIYARNLISQENHTLVTFDYIRYKLRVMYEKYDDKYKDLYVKIKNIIMNI